VCVRARARARVRMFPRLSTITTKEILKL
jgi:hypothetical protein